MRKPSLNPKPSKKEMENKTRTELIQMLLDGKLAFLARIESHRRASITGVTGGAAAYLSGEPVKPIKPEIKLSPINNDKEHQAPLRESFMPPTMKN
jgi:hypothetical protein